MRVPEDVAIRGDLMLARANAVDLAFGRPHVAGPAMLAKGERDVFLGEPR